ncbi:hypothetical protein KQI61_07925 [Anaerocolumna aminovalerica]|uniref:hypothetical protein n=1 Tax=Anaerocolumna aminovalerica TaxID=1527 RepID=UPI001C0EE786|nr:hypothetical protein [Anaerocolumna aminovalerica]MBU5332124.1 hypothetical protein [Anaerocolumna aminovalerica]
MQQDIDIEQLGDVECKICGAKYKYCSTCKEFKTIESWRQHVDTINCYKIFMVIQDFSKHNIDKLEARKLLVKCDLSNSNNFFSWIQYQINRIMADD